MSSTILHMAIGMGAGTLIFARLPIRAFRGSDSPAKDLARWIAASWALGVFAAAPNFLAAAGLPYSLFDGWWSNIFLFHHLIDLLKPGGDLIGQLAVSFCGAVQYTAIICVLAKIRALVKRQERLQNC